MRASLRFGRYEIRRAAEADPALPRRRVASASDAIALLRQLGVSASAARRLIHAFGRSASSEGDVLGALAALLWRGSYVLHEHPLPVRVPLMEMSEAESEHEELEPEAPPEPDDGHPPPLVCYEYPRVASYIAQGLDTAVAQCRRRLEEEFFRGHAPVPVDEVPLAYRDMARDKHLEITAQAHHATLRIERLLHQEGELGNPTSTLTEVYREIADTKRTQIVGFVSSIADRLDGLRYMGETDLSKAEAVLHEDESRAV